MRRFKIPLIALAVLYMTCGLFLDANTIPSGAQIPTLKVGDYIISHNLYPLAGTPERGDLVTFRPPESDRVRYIKRIVGMPGDRLRIRQVPACGLPELTGIAPDPETISERKYTCGSAEEPVVALVEYRPGDAGPWLNYQPVEQSYSRTRADLSDADNAHVLQADQLPAEMESRHPVLFQETSGDRRFFTVESSIRADMINMIGAEDLLVPEGAYFLLGDNRDDSKDSRYIGTIDFNRFVGRGLFVYWSFNWRDDICKEYLRWKSRYDPESGGFDLTEFGPTDQAQYCNDLDEYRITSFFGGIVLWLRHLPVRLARMSVRWERIGTTL